MTLDPTIPQHFRDVLNAGFPGFASFKDVRFKGLETNYKRQASAKAKTWFSESALRALLENEPEKIANRVSELARETNLLFMGVPRQGDLALVHTDGLKGTDLGGQLLDLLHGPDDSPTRLERFSRWAEERKLPNKWTFPTYVLFLVHPETELFVKPREISGFLKLTNSEVDLGRVPSGDVYRHLLQIAGELKEALADLNPEDMIDIQSAIFLAHAWGKDMRLTPEGREELRSLIREFQTDYLQTEEGARHQSYYRTMRESAIANMRTLREARTQGQELTNPILLKLLPHKDSESNRERGAWISVAPAIQGDVRQWFENKGWVSPGDWPKVTRALFEFVERVVESPEDLEERVQDLEKSGLGKGFQSGMLSPILSALRPEECLLINAKSRRVINHFLDLEYSQALSDYPALNRNGHYLIGQVREVLEDVLPADVSPTEGFDALSHWLVAVRKHPFGKSQFWRVQISNVEAWTGWATAGVIGYPDQDLGDAAVLKTKDWKTPPPGADPQLVDAIRHIASKMSEGDEVLVIDEESVVRGIGRVSGGYEYREGEILAHVLPIDWEDTTARKSFGRPHKKLIKSMQAAEAEALRDLPPLDSTPTGDGLFSARTFELLDGLTKNPTKAFYDQYKEKFGTHLEGPFKRLLQSVAAELPPPMLEVLETEKRLFSKILKNDFGRGGAWDYYWGAFYPKGQKRIAGAQLFVWMNRNRLGWGFYVGDYGDDVAERMLGQFRRRREALRSILRDHLDEGRFIFGAEIGSDGEPIEGTGTASLDEWLDNLAAGSLTARTKLTRDQALAMSEAEIRDQIVTDFRQLFPLILIAISDDPVAALESLAGPIEEIEIQPEYTLETCASETGLDLKTLSMWYEAIERKGQAILYGPPGTGKTFMAEHLARVLIGGGDGFSDLVQFHPAYAYEDFMQGIRPGASADGGLEFDMKAGRFMDFCRMAQSRRDTCVLIIDEINRANLSRVFGELMYLFEYREQDVPLAGGGRFKIPGNVRIIGTMNTADRSIALVDHALRRRFAFLALRPNDDVLRHYHENTGQSVDALIEKLAELNRAIEDENYHVGITFFMDSDLDKNLEAIWRMEIEPYLEEYFFDESEKVNRFRWERIEADLTGSG